MMNDKNETKEEKDESLSQKLLETRTIVISGAVDGKMADQIIKQLLVLESMDAKAEIRIIINSPGGEIQSGFAIYDMLHFIECPVVTIVAGLAASMGSILSLSGDKGKKYAFPHAKIMIHQPLLTGAQGTTIDLEIHSEQIIKTRKLLADLYAKKTGKTAKQILKDMERDHWLTAKESLDYGLIDKVINKRSDL
ncbi:MAG: ATP-dependent Clp protease proteolytic subunit [Proteobacteria bacterium]|nr:ATP-dependent Clp protease proteolytic subunit [Pseudomonadota bacterium]